MNARMSKADAPATSAPPIADPAATDHCRQRVYRSYEAFLSQRLVQLDRQRGERWQRDYSSLEAYERSVAPMRERFKRMLGFWIEPGERERLEPQTIQVLAETEAYVARRMVLPVLPGLETYAIELIPKRPGPHPGLLVQHGYGATPEWVCGFVPIANTDADPYRSLGLRAVHHGFHVMAVHHPSGYGSLDQHVTVPADRFPAQSNWYGKNRLHRMALLAGGTLVGLDMLASSRGVDWLLGPAGVHPARIGIYGLSQGGLTALFLPAMDQRIKAAVCSGYFNGRLAKLVGPHRSLSYLDSHEEDKFFPEVVPCFGDADLASLIAPRPFAVEAGRRDTSIDFEKSQAEFERARLHFEQLVLAGNAEFIAHDEGHVSASPRAFAFLLERLAP